MKESDFMLANNGFSTRDLKKKNENKHIINVIFQNSSPIFFSTFPPLNRKCTKPLKMKFGKFSTLLNQSADNYHIIMISHLHRLRLRHHPLRVSLILLLTN